MLAGLGILGTSCQKDQISPLSSTKTPNAISNRPAVVYANLSCKLPDETWGCQCTITQTDDDCSLQTECTKATNSTARNGNLKNYHKAITKMFSEEEIIRRAKNNVRITEPELIEALKKDGFPVK